jgi:tol-pal system protein YbgF
VIRSKPVLPALFAAACLTLAAAPSTAALFGDDVARKGVAEQQKRLDGLTSRYDELATRLAKLEDAVKAQAAQTSAATQPVLDLANQIQVLREELRGMRGQLEVLSNGIEAASRRQRDMYVDLDTRLRRFEQAPPAPAPGAAAPAPGPASAPPGASAPPMAAAAAAAAAAPPAVDETRAYEAAQNQRRIGNYQAAVVAFQTFVTHYPRSPLAHRAQYWVGDSYYNLRDYKSAIANQQKLISTYPESASVPDALLNMASAHIELGDTATARKTMDKLVARYPSSDAAEKARRRLTALR